MRYEFRYAVDTRSTSFAPSYTSAPSTDQLLSPLLLVLAHRRITNFFHLHLDHVAPCFGNKAITIVCQLLIFNRQATAYSPPCIIDSIERKNRNLQAGIEYAPNADLHARGTCGSPKTIIQIRHRGWLTKSDLWLKPYTACTTMVEHTLHSTQLWKKNIAVSGKVEGEPSLEDIEMSLKFCESHVRSVVGTKTWPTFDESYQEHGHRDNK